MNTQKQRQSVLVSLESDGFVRVFCNRKAVDVQLVELFAENSDQQIYELPDRYVILYRQDYLAAAGLPLNGRIPKPCPSDWLGLFCERILQVYGYQEGQKILVECWPDMFG